eukprot:2127047-Prymnesium_polylepis.1
MAGALRLPYKLLEIRVCRLPLERVTCPAGVAHLVARAAAAAHKVRHLQMAIGVQLETGCTDAAATQRAVIGNKESLAR